MDELTFFINREQVKKIREIAPNMVKFSFVAEGSKGMQMTISQQDKKDYNDWYNYKQARIISLLEDNKDNIESDVVVHNKAIASMVLAELQYFTPDEYFKNIKK